MMIGSVRSFTAFVSGAVSGTGAPWATILTAKALLLVVVLGAAFMNFDEDRFKSAFARWPRTETPTLASRFSTWDIAHYLRLSQEGYDTGSPSCAFYPLWPGVLRVSTVLTGGRLVLAAMLLANALSLVGLWMLYRLVERHYGAAISRDALILMLAFPGALFFSFPYSESLYLVLLMWFFWGLEKERWTWVAASAFLLPLARPLGVFVLLPLAWYLFERGWLWGRAPLPLRGGEEKARAVATGQELANFSRRGNRVVPKLLLLCPLLGYATYFGLMYVWTGNAFEGFEAQKAYPNSPSIRNMFDFPHFINALLNVNSLDGMMDGALDRVFFLLFLASLPLIYRLNRTWFYYALPAGLVPALTSWFMSYRRYTMMLFPVFVVVAQLLSKSRSRSLFWYYVILLAAAQAWAVTQFVNFRWAG